MNIFASQRHRSTALASLFLKLVPYLLALVTALMLAQVISASVLILTVLFVGGIVACLLLIQPIKLLWLTTLMTLVVAGLLRYFVPDMEKIWWVTFVMAALLFVPAIYAQILSPISSPHVSARPVYSTPGLWPPVLFFIGVVAFTTLLNGTPLYNLLTGTKSLFMFGGVWAALAVLPLSQAVIQRLLLMLLAIGSIQWLPALYQFLFVRTTSIGNDFGLMVAADRVVGTFGGDIESGGLSGVLAMYLVIIIVMLLAFYRRGLLERRTLAWLLGLNLIPLMLMEVKVIFIYLPLALLLLYKDTALRKPLSFISAGLLVVILLGGFIITYNAIHWSMVMGGKNLETNVKSTFSYSFAEQSVGIKDDSGIMTRRQVLDFWWDKHGLNNPLHTLIGHGLSSSHRPGHIGNYYYPLKIARTGLSTLLWETGMLGVAAFTMLIVSGYRLGRRLASSDYLNPGQQSLAHGLYAVIPLFLLSLGYRHDIPYAAPQMFIFMTAFGLLAWLQAQERTTSSVASQSGSKIIAAYLAIIRGAKNKLAAPSGETAAAPGPQVSTTGYSAGKDNGTTTIKVKRKDGSVREILVDFIAGDGKDLEPPAAFKEAKAGNNRKHLGTSQADSSSMREPSRGSDLGRPDQSVV